MLSFFRKGHKYGLSSFVTLEVSIEYQICSFSSHVNANLHSTVATSLSSIIALLLNNHILLLALILILRFRLFLLHLVVLVFLHRRQRYIFFLLFSLWLKLEPRIQTIIIPCEGLIEGLERRIMRSDTRCISARYWGRRLRFCSFRVGCRRVIRL